MSSSPIAVHDVTTIASVFLNRSPPPAVGVQTYVIESITRKDYINVTTGCNSPNWTEPEKDIWQPHVIQRVATIVVVMVLALLGNTAIILLLTCTRYWKRHSRVNIFIIHLAIGDLTVCFCTMTTEIIFVAFDQWVLGAALCKILTYLQLITLASTTFILTAMSFDRYLAICKPLKYRATTARAKKFIAISWILAFVLCLPQLLIFVQTEERRGCRTFYQCRSKGYTALWQRMLYFSFTTFYILVVPVILISFFYVSIVLVVAKASRVIQNEANPTADLPLRRPSAQPGGKATFPRAKIKTLKMTFAIIATFVVCWTPYFVTTLVRIYSNYDIHIPDSVMAFVETIAFVQSLLNPLLYGFFNVKIKRGVRELVCSSKNKDHPRRSPSYNYQRSPGPMLSVSSGGNAAAAALGGRGGGGGGANNARPVYEMKLCGKTRLQEPAVNNASASSSGGNSQDRSARGSSSVVLTEENMNGVRLRVRFTCREPCRYFSTDVLDYCKAELLSPYDPWRSLSHPASSSSPHAPHALYRPQSQQQLYHRQMMK